MVDDWDEVISSDDPDFLTSGLHRDSAIRLSYLYAADVADIRGSIGSIDAIRLQRLRRRLASRLEQ